MPEAKRPLKVFLCHAHADCDAVRALYNHLIKDGVDAWLDKEKLIPGQDWEYKTRNAVRESDVVVVCLSTQFNQAGFRQKEVRLALDTAMEKPEGDIFIIPARLEECDTPENLSKWHWVDLFEEDGYEKLMRALRVRAEEIDVTLQDKKNWLPTLNTQPIVEKKHPKVEALLKQKTENPKLKKEIQKSKGLQKIAIGFGGLAMLSLVVIFGLLHPWNKIPAPVVAVTHTPSSMTFTPTNLITLAPTKTIVPTPTLGIGSTMVSEKDGATLVFVPAGDFLMGSADDDLLAAPDEKPQHKVTLDAFWIDKTEVTNAMYAKCVADGVCKKPFKLSSSTHPNYFGNSEFDNSPVIYVDWNMAKTYCEWAGRELPTAAQWEKAARGPNGNIYPWGNVFDGLRGNFCDVNCAKPWANKTFNDGYSDVSPVGKFPLGQSFYGALDMAGNVGEWVNDWYSETYYQNSPSVNPLGPSTGTYRGLRGGSFIWKSDYVRAADNGYDLPKVPGKYFGIRCAFSP